RALAAAGLLAHGRAAPLGLRLTTDGRLAFATPMWMIARVHGRAANGRPNTHVPGAAGFPDAQRSVLRVTDLSQSSHTFDVHQPDLARRQPHLCPAAFLGHQ